MFHQEYPGQGTPQAVQSGLAFECMPSAMTTLVVVAMALGNETGAEHGEAATQAGALHVIFGAGGALAVGCLGTGGPGHWGGWSNVGAETTAGDAEATDGALHVVLSDWSEA